MRVKTIIKIATVAFILVAWGMGDAWAMQEWYDGRLTLGGFLRYETSFNTGVKNPNNVDQDDKNTLTFARSYFQPELNWKPADNFKVFFSPVFMVDFTDQWDSDVGSFRAFPIDVPQYDWTMMKVSDDKRRAEIRELYADINIEKLWLRLGRQQIVWGEMIGARYMDIVNSLDYSRNTRFEPEEFENIRIPNWAIRARYAFGNIAGLIQEFMVEGFVNPGDQYPDIYADYGSPLNVLPNFPPFFRITDKDRRGDTTYGIRTGGMLGDFYVTLNYLLLYNSGGMFNLKGFTPDPIFGVPVFAPADFTPYAFLINREYPSINVYGLTANYYYEPLDMAINLEGTWTPNQPYGDAAQDGLAIRDQGTLNYAINFSKPASIFPPDFFHANFMSINVQFSQTAREGDKDKILASGAKVDTSDEWLTLNCSQWFMYNTYKFAFLLVYDLDGATLFKPQFQYVYGTNWFLDLYYVHTAGSEDRPGRFGGMEFLNEAVFRITFQF